MWGHIVLMILWPSAVLCEVCVVGGALTIIGEPELALRGRTGQGMLSNLSWVAGAPGGGLR